MNNVRVLFDRRNRLRPLRDVSQLHPQVLAIIGLWHMGIRSFNEIVSLILVGRNKLWVERLCRIVDVLHHTKNPLVRQWVDEGLPPGACGPLAEPKRVLCHLCRNMVNYVPCPHCSVRNAEPISAAKERSKDAKPCSPTMAYPGTPEKIEVLRQRASCGEMLFHELDPVLRDGAEGTCHESSERRRP